VDVASAAPAEASALPVSDKPVTLSFKGGSKPTNLTGLSLSVSFSPTSKFLSGTPASNTPAASTLGFSMTEEGDSDGADGDRAASNEDPKGLSHPRYEERSFWTCILMVRAQLLQPRKWLL
jgi:RNA-binding protein 5/10